MLPFWRLDPPFRFAVYIAFAVLIASGAAWLIADRMKETSKAEIWQETAATLLMLHGGTAMLTLMLLGALVPLHIGRAWRAGKNRATGIVMLTFDAVLIATAFGLYYLASETLRPWVSDIHIAFGLAMAHVKTGRLPSTPRVPRSGPDCQAPPRS
jgi:hypothetical protein